MSKAKPAAKAEKGKSASVLEFKRPTQAPKGPLVAEIVASADVDRVCADIGEYVTLWTQAKATELSNAYMWMMARAGQGFLLVAHDHETLYAASFWKLENWTNGVVLRCVAAAGNSIAPSEWVGPFIETARSIAKASGAERLCFDAYEDEVGEALPEEATPCRKSYMMGV